MCPKINSAAKKLFSTTTSEITNFSVFYCFKKKNKQKYATIFIMFIMLGFVRLWNTFSSWRNGGQQRKHIGNLKSIVILSRSVLGIISVVHILVVLRLNDEMLLTK